MNYLYPIIIAVFVFLGLYDLLSFVLLYKNFWITPWYIDMLLVLACFIIGSSLPATQQKTTRKVFLGLFCFSFFTGINKSVAAILYNTLGKTIVQSQPNDLVSREMLYSMSKHILLLAPLSSLLGIIMLIAYLKLPQSESLKQFLLTFNPLKFDLLFEKKNSKYDVQICTDKFTGKPIALKYIDRFLHMLILGPTGSGKSSQVLLPMINQDLQKEGLGLTVIDPKGDLVRTVTKMAKFYNRKVFYFDPTDPNCPYFNPLFGPEEDVIEDVVTTFKMLSPDSTSYFQDLNETLLRNSLKVLKRTMGNNCNFLHLYDLLYDTKGLGRAQVIKLGRAPALNPAMKKENEDIVDWFIREYFEKNSKIYENAGGLRTQISKITSNAYLRKVLNPPEGYVPEIDFTKHLEEGTVICINAAQGALKSLSKYLGYFLILQFQSAVFRRPGNEKTRRPHILYIDEFQEFANPGFTQMLTQGRSYRCASVLATLNRALIASGGGRDGKNFAESVTTNARNIVIFPGGNPEDALYYSKKFGEELTIAKTVSKKAHIFKSPFSFLDPKHAPTVAEREEIKLRFTPTDLMELPFGEVTLQIIKDGSVQKATVGKIDWIPRSIMDQIEQVPVYEGPEIVPEEAQTEMEEKEFEISAVKEFQNESNEELDDDLIFPVNNQVISKETIPIKDIEINLSTGNSKPETFIPVDQVPESNDVPKQKDGQMELFDFNDFQESVEELQKTKKTTNSLVLESDEFDDTI